MERSNESLYVGIDVSKCYWDVAVDGSNKVERFTTNKEGGNKLMTKMKKWKPELVCFEATGGWEQPLADLLWEKGVTISIVNPRQVRDFAKACGQLAKTDRIDALMIARYGSTMKPKITEKPSENQRKLRALRTRRTQAQKAKNQESNRLGTLHDDEIEILVKQSIEFYKNQIEELDKQIEKLVKNNAEFKKRTQLMVAVKSIGITTAAALLAEIPELGTLNRPQVGRLSGLAPINRDSGMFRGKRMIGGGRASVRNAIYMATLSAIKHNPAIKKFHDRLISNGKSKMTAITACMRKLLIILNAILRDESPWNPNLNA